MEELKEMSIKVSKLETRTIALERLMERVRSKAKGDIERLTRHNKKLAKERDDAIARAEAAEAQLESWREASVMAQGGR